MRKGGFREEGKRIGVRERDWIEKILEMERELRGSRSWKRRRKQKFKHLWGGEGLAGIVVKAENPAQRDPGSIPHQGKVQRQTDRKPARNEKEGGQDLVM